MEHHGMNEPDYGTGQKKLELYLVGFISCSILTVFSFWSVMSQRFSKLEVLALIFSSACIQFLVQVLSPSLSESQNLSLVWGLGTQISLNGLTRSHSIDIRVRKRLILDKWSSGLKTKSH